MKTQKKGDIRKNANVSRPHGNVAVFGAKSSDFRLHGSDLKSVKKAAQENRDRGALRR